MMGIRRRNPADQPNGFPVSNRPLTENPDTGFRRPRHRFPRRLAAAALAVLAAALGCGEGAVRGGEAPPAVREWTAMGTRIRLSVRGPDAEARADAMARAARDALEAVEAETSAFRAGNAVARTAEAAGSGNWTATGPAFDEALGMALAVAEATDGAFNPLVAPLLERHGFPRRPAGSAVPDGAVPPEWLDWTAIERHPGACRLPLAGMRLDFGGVAKGVGADRAVAAAGRAAEGDFLLDAGGTLAGRGDWRVGLRDPRGGPDAPPLRVFTLSGGMACATSGHYERPGHLVDPRSGRPADGGGTVLQATAVAPTAAEADAWSTALFVLGPEAGRAALEKRGGALAGAWVVAAGGGGVAVVQVPAPR